MKKITTVFLAMLLLTLSVLAAHADQEGNARWCNIDSDGCYLNEEGGIKSYMYFWTVESCRYFMGNDNPCTNVVPFYTEDKYRHPLEPAPEPIVYTPNPGIQNREFTIPVVIIETISGEEMFRLMFPEGVAEFNGVMIVTDLDGLQEGENQRLVSLETAGSGKELLIPVYRPREGFSQEDFFLNFGDFDPMTAELSESGKTALLGGSGAKSSFLIPYETEDEYSEVMNSNLNKTLEDNFVLAGYVSSSGVGVSPKEERRMEAKSIDSGNEESSGTDSGSGSGGSGSDDNRNGSSLPVQFSNNEFDKSSGSINLPGPGSPGGGSNGGGGTGSPAPVKQPGASSSMFGGVMALPSNIVLNVVNSGTLGTPGNTPGIISDNSRLILVRKPGNAGSAQTAGELTANGGSAVGGLTANGKVVGGKFTITRGLPSGDITANNGRVEGRDITANGALVGGKVTANGALVGGGNQIMITGIESVTLGPGIAGGLAGQGEVQAGRNTEGLIAGGGLPTLLFTFPKSSNGPEASAEAAGSQNPSPGLVPNANPEFEVHIYNGSLKSENFIYKPGFGQERNSDDAWSEWWAEAIMDLSGPNQEIP